MSKTLKIIAWILWPITMWYAIGVFVRNLLFDLGIKRENTVPVTTIGVGNLSMGGTGKTPMVEYLLRLFGDDYRTAYLSRGYHRSTSGYVECDETTDAEDIGDEASMVARKFPNITVAVCERRVEGVKNLLKKEEAPQLVVLDDNFQHRFIKPTVNILLTEYNNLYCNDRILPFGNLREGRRAYRRANIVIVTKSPEKPNPMDIHNVVLKLNLRTYQKLFFSYIRYDDPVALFPDSSEQTLPLDSCHQVLLVTGIANPRPMMHYVKKSCKIATIEYPDHHEYSEEDIAHIREQYGQMRKESSIILTTEKDAAKLRDDRYAGLLADLPIYYLPITVAFHSNKREDSFDDTVRNIVKENVFFLQRIANTSLLD